MARPPPKPPTPPEYAWMSHRAKALVPPFSPGRSHRTLISAIICGRPYFHAGAWWVQVQPLNHKNSTGGVTQSIEARFVQRPGEP